MALTLPGSLAQKGKAITKKVSMLHEQGPHGAVLNTEPAFSESHIAGRKACNAAYEMVLGMNAVDLNKSSHFQIS